MARSIWRTWVSCAVVDTDALAIFRFEAIVTITSVRFNSVCACRVGAANYTDTVVYVVAHVAHVVLYKTGITVACKRFVAVFTSRIVGAGCAVAIVDRYTCIGGASEAVVTLAFIRLHSIVATGIGCAGHSRTIVNVHALNSLANSLGFKTRLTLTLAKALVVNAYHVICRAKLVKSNYWVCTFFICMARCVSLSFNGLSGRSYA